MAPRSKTVNTALPACHELLCQRAAGILLHLSSLPCGHGIGDLGPEAYRFVNWLQAAGMRFWQMLPIGPVGKGNSPYSARSAFAGEPLFISLQMLVDAGWLKRSEIRTGGALNAGRVRYPTVRRYKYARFRRAFGRFVQSGGQRRRGYRSFVRNHADWLTGWCAYAARQDGGSPEFHAFLQWVFDEQWVALRAYAAQKGVRLIGDLPIFVSPESADVVTNPELFRLDRRTGKPTVVTGVPPDCFSRDGQLWEHPHYAWKRHIASDFAWWVQRVRLLLARFDLLRLDHFVGFTHLYEIPGHAGTARKGRWRKTPGRELLTELRRHVGPLPFLAEDLGHVTKAVTRLRIDFGLPGMRILQNAFGGEGDSVDRPHHHPADSVVYTGTHDNDTTVGWWQTLNRASRKRVQAYAGSDVGRDTIRDAMVRLCLTSPANLAVVPMPDVLGLGREARMNRPGETSTRNWSWRLRRGQVRMKEARELRKVMAVAGRCE